MKWGTALGRPRPNGALYNQVIDGHDYYLQQLYSNATETCVQRKALPPVVSKLAPAKGSLAGGTKVKITGLNLREPDGHECLVRESGGERIHGHLPDVNHGHLPGVHEHGRREVKLTSSGGTSASTTGRPVHIRNKIGRAAQAAAV